MSTPQSCRAVYKTIGTQEIDSDVYLPRPGPSDGAQRHPVGMAFPKLYNDCMLTVLAK